MSHSSYTSLYIITHHLGSFKTMDCWSFHGLMLAKPMFVLSHGWKQNTYTYMYAWLIANNILLHHLRHSSVKPSLVLSCTHDTKRKFLLSHENINTHTWWCIHDFWVFTTTWWFHHLISMSGLDHYATMTSSYICLVTWMEANTHILWWCMITMSCFHHHSVHNAPINPFMHPKQPSYQPWFSITCMMIYAWPMLIPCFHHFSRSWLMNQWEQTMNAIGLVTRSKEIYITSFTWWWYMHDWRVFLFSWKYIWFHHLEGSPII